jgi:hypothetical protein
MPDHRAAIGCFLLIGTLVGCGGSASAPAPIDPAGSSGLTHEEQAVEVARSDERLTELLEANPHEVVSVRDPDQSDRGMLVVVEFDRPLDDAGDYPLDVCAIDVGDRPITGIVWLVDGDEVLAVSPVWGDDVSCGY